VDRNLARKLKSAGLSMVYVTVYGPDEEGHRLIARADTFRRSLDAISACVAEGLPVRGSMVATRELLQKGCFRQLQDLMRKVGAEGLRVLYPMATGAWASRKDVLLTPEEKREVDSHMDGTFTFYSDRSTTIDCPAVYRGYWFVGPSGEVLPCPNIPLVLGNIREEPLTSLLSRAQQDYASTGWSRYFGDTTGCPMSDDRAFEITLDGRLGRRFLPNQNYLDLGGIPRWVHGRIRPWRPMEEVMGEIENRLGRENHLYLTGGSLMDYPDGPRLLGALGERGVQTTVVEDPRRLASAEGLRLLESGVIRTVVMPVQWRGDEAGAGGLAPLSESLWMDETSQRWPVHSACSKRGRSACSSW
jgi:hypothetical protein